MSEYKTNEANAGVWTAMFPGKATEAHTKGRITTLIDLSRQGDVKATERLMEEHLDTIKQIVSEQKNLYKLTGDENEAVKAGQLGLIEAICRYNPERRDFQSYMRPFIIGRVVDSLTGHRK